MEKSYLEELIQEGLTQRTIAERIGKSQASVKHWLKKHGLKTQHQQYNRRVGPACCKYCEESDPDKFVGRGADRKCQSVCSACHTQITIERYRIKKLQAIEYKGGKCSRCGYDKCPGSLHFNHRDASEKDPHWKHVRSWSFQKIKVELEKCDLLCANCHGEVHWLSGPVAQLE